jgi:hypothetical protein
VDFDGTGEYLIADNRVIAADDLLSLHVVATFNNLSARGRVVGSLFYVNTSNNGGFSFESNVFNNSNGIAGYGNDTLVTHDAEDTVTQGEEELYSLQLQSGTSNWYVNGTLEDSVSTGMNAEDGGNLLTIGAGQAGTSPHNGSIKEIILYNSDQSDNRTAIEANIGETYGITDIPATTVQPLRLTSVRPTALLTSLLLTIQSTDSCRRGTTRAVKGMTRSRVLPQVSQRLLAR